MILSILFWLVVAGLAAHGIAHIVGFAVAWRLMSSPDVPYHTTLLNGRLEIGDSGMRVMGLLWLGAAMAFVASAALLAMRSPSAVIWIAAVSLASLVLCATEWPFARVGLTVDVVILLTLPALGAIAWRSDSRDAAALLAASRDRSAIVAEHVYDTLPPPVARYFGRVLGRDQPAIRTVALEQDAEFFVGGAWRPLRATQTFAVAPPGFLWDARIAMAPFVPVFVRDAYIDRRGSMRADLLGVYSVVRQANRAELNAGALHRYLAEAVWFPTALLPSAGVRWEPVDDHAATATLTDGPTTVALEFRFDEEGDVREIFTPARFAEDSGRYAPRPWLVRCSEYETHDGVRIPVRCEVEWPLPSGPQPYWRGRIVGIRYAFDPISVLSEVEGRSKA